MTDPTVNPSREARRHLTAAYLTDRERRADGGKSDAPLRVAAAQAEATLAVAEQLRAMLAEQERHHREISGLYTVGVRIEQRLGVIADTLGAQPDARTRTARLREIADRWERSAAVAASAGDSCAEDRNFILRHCVAEIRQITDPAEVPDAEIVDDEPDDPDEPVDTSLRAVVHRAVVHSVYACCADRDVDLAVARDLHDLAWHVAGAIHGAGHDYPDRHAIVNRLAAQCVGGVSWPMDDPEAIDAAVAAICGDPDPIEPEPAAGVQPAEPGDLTARQRAVVRAAIDQCAERYEARGDILNVFDRQRRGDVATGIALAVSSAGLGQPDWHYLDDVIRRHLAGGGFNVEGWPMDTENARAALTELLCDAPPEPYEHPVIRRDEPAGVPAPRDADHDTDQ